MKFAHISDSHLGYRQFGLMERENDFIEVFYQAIGKVIEERPDFVVHSGDLFEHSRPPTKALLAAQAGFSWLKEAGIPVFAVPGNHDVVMRRSSLPPHVLFRDFGVKLLSPKHPSQVMGDVFIGGLPYTSKYFMDQYVERLGHLGKDSQEYGKRVLVLHQGLDKYIPIDFELPIADLPGDFDYYAMGHIHDRIIDNYGRGVLSYAGSTEMWRFNELKDYLEHGKGFNLVDLGGDQATVERVDLELSRDLIDETIMVGQLEEKLKTLRGHITRLGKPPLAMVTVKGGNLGRGDVYERVNNCLKEICLSLRTSYKPTTNNPEAPRRKGEEALTADTLIRERMKEFKNEKVEELAVDLSKELADGELEVASGLVSQFYGEVMG